MAEVEIGANVKAHYNSGTYIGTVKEDRGNRYLIEVHAVLKHPLQGDIHHPGEVEGVFFHERKALAPHEKMNVKKPAVHPYIDIIPEYNESLRDAVNVYKEKLCSKDNDFNNKAYHTLTELENKYYKDKYY
ncbi:kinase-associated lipoprotein B [Virgibacillus halodenitrificans]|uniref:kinase-associated lipoprotein B n=1 Tax=Virgibacillus halodenitrificans TaxID=1482 RepID=UPI001FB4489E|nr:kinase-associated lipoprotein B [Virgibacillus halodenitrificans]MCJ0932738.1 kinase-associated lipoprotein B [Virgibacillus halodenitrificans]